MRSAERLFLALCLLWTYAGCSSQAQSTWVRLSPHGRLLYTTTPNGDRIPDFSTAGYEGGGVALPTVPVKRTVSPSGGDDTSVIQAAIDQVSTLPLVGGHRGAVELQAGIYHCAGTLVIATSGVVLRGTGSSENGSQVVLTGEPHLGLRIAGHMEQSFAGLETTISNDYVPAGATSVKVASARGFEVGDTVSISKPVTATWLKFMGMDDLHRNGAPEHWVGNDPLEVRRRIAAVHGNTIFLAVPLMDNYDARFFDGEHARVRRVNVTGQISQTGVEDLRIVAPKRAIPIGVPEFQGIFMENAVDSWLRRVVIVDATNGIHIRSGTERITVVECDVQQHVDVTSGAKPFNFSASGSQILFDRCTGTGDATFYFGTQARQQGPVVLLHCQFTGQGHIQPHQRWFVGLLIDSCEVPQGSIDMMNRGEMGTGHGWPIGWSVVWNSTAKSFGMNSPPGSYIWSIGNRGPHSNPPMPVFDGSVRPALHAATIDHQGAPVTPASLYVAQLRDRRRSESAHPVLTMQ